MTKDSSKTPDCKICMVAHDEEIHAATLGVRGWFYDQVTRHFEDDEEYIVYEEVEQTVTAA
jgi:hypothetical protein